jgi:hypothetical protein
MAYHYESNEFTDMLLMYGQFYHNAAAASREYTERFSERHHPGPRQFINLAQRRNKQDRTQNFRKNKNIQSIISVNTNILLRRFRLKKGNFGNTLYNLNTKIHIRSCVYTSIDNEARKKITRLGKILERKTVKNC